MHKKISHAFALMSGIILLLGCAGTAPVSQPPGTQPVMPPVTASASSSAEAAQQPSLPANPRVPAKPQLSNRVDVIYFHMNQRCVTCLCFEEHVNRVIEAYFGDAISAGKLTYRVLNAQEKQNTEIAKKYKVIGSQLFINMVVNDFDNIEDIQDIWDWNCRNDANGFELKTRYAIDKRLQTVK